MGFPLFSTGKISGTKAAKLKASFSLLHDTLKSSQQSEICLCLSVTPISPPQLSAVRDLSVSVCDSHLPTPALSSQQSEIWLCLSVTPISPPQLSALSAVRDLAVSVCDSPSPHPSSQQSEISLCLSVTPISPPQLSAVRDLAVSVCDPHLPTPALSSQRSGCLSAVRDLAVSVCDSPSPHPSSQQSEISLCLSVTPISPPQLSALRDLAVSQQSEIWLLQEAKRFRAELERQQRDLEEAEQFPEGPDTEVSRMRQQLLKFHNDLRQAEERDYQMNYQLECLTEEKLCLEKEYETQPKPVELEKRAKALKDSSEELRKEVSQRRQEIHSLLEDVEARHKLMTREQRELDHKKDIIVNNQAELAQLLSVPGQLGKEIERINRKKMDVEKSKAALDEQLSEVAALQKMTEARCRSLEEEKREVRRQVEGRRAHLEAAEREHSMLQKEQEMTKEKEVIMMGQRGMLDINTGHCIMERKSVHENLARKQRERDRQLRELKKVELQLKMAQDALVHTQLLHDKTKYTRDAKPKSDRILKTRQEIQLEVDKLKRNLIHQQPVAEVETQLIEQCVEQEKELMRQSHRHREELHTLCCLTQIKADEREQKSRDRHRAEQRYNRIKQEVRGKSLVIHELKKQNQEVQSRLGVFAKLYDNIKGDRNKCMNLIQMASQRTAEMREKFKILDNEIEILRTNAINKEKLLQKSRLKHFHSHTVRDSLRSDISKVTQGLHEMRQKREEQKLNLGRLTHMINYHEQNLLQMRKSHDNAVQSRNDR
ncbi:coiled-coil domain-containing protein 146-like [Salvelinus fontinalis]|uniref:coiled-coil domain-containing protein 146-like n=1 Tax=Salvelinus fontinalis TaxID=8038 RepID=UPI00248585DE|nr:coiled-coil domain-containing protein 146-like [Salvelinus fontinalis]